MKETTNHILDMYFDMLRRKDIKLFEKGFTCEVIILIICQLKSSTILILKALL